MSVGPERGDAAVLQVDIGYEGGAECLWRAGVHGGLAMGLAGGGLGVRVDLSRQRRRYGGGV